MSDDTTDTLARYIAAAWIAYRFGIGLEYALKRYVIPNQRQLHPSFSELAKSMAETSVEVTREEYMGRPN